MATSEAADPHDTTAALCRHAAWLVGAVSGPVRRVRMRAGDTSLELEWAESHHGQHDGGDAPAGDERDPGLAYVCAPLVGTFYRAPREGAAPFVDVGDVVEPGQQLAIVEAMKLMNPVSAEVAGRVTEVLVADATPVEYAQPLFAVAPADALP